MDSIVTSVIQSFKQRSEFGQQKYGTNMDRTDLKFLDWVQHMQEELMDAIIYLEKMKYMFKTDQTHSNYQVARMYVPMYYRLSIDAVDSMIYSWGDSHVVTWFDLMAIDYAHHHKDIDYDGGMSFIYRIYNKLHHLHPFWNINILTGDITDSNSYTLRVAALFRDQADIDYYGV